MDMALRAPRAPAADLRLDEDNPWPGLAAYDEASQRFFEGRDQQALELQRLVKQFPQTALYGKSGLGKSSLLQAGLFPLLRPEHFLPVYLRLDLGPGARPAEHLMQRLLDALDDASADFTPPGPGESIWHYLHRRDLELWSQDNYPLTPLLVIDQFEELFVPRPSGTPSVESVMNLLGDLIESRVPEELAGPNADRQALARLNVQSLRYRCVLSFREDYLPVLKGWEKQVPNLLRNFLRLEPMSRAQAVDAVVRPGAKVLAPGVADRIVDFVGNVDDSGAGTAGDDSIEPVLLSLCCTQLNARRAPGTLIDAALLDKAGQDILSDFYQGALKGMPAVATFIEDQLVQGDRYRASYAAELALQEGRISAEQLRLLTDTHRLLRIDPQSGVNRIELIHDRLVGVVVAARDRRRALQRAAEAQREREKVEQLERARHLHSSRNRFRAMAGVLALLLLIAGWSSWRAWELKERADREARRAQDQSVFASAAAARAIKAEAEARAAAAEADKQRELANRLSEMAMEDSTAARQARQAAERDRQRALTAEARATHVSRQATALRLAAESQAMQAGVRAGGDHLALLQLVAAFRIAPDNAAVGTQLLGAIGNQSALAKIVETGTDTIAAVFSPDGTRVASAGMDGTVRLWDARSGRSLGVIGRHAGGALNVRFSPDGQQLASSGEDHGVNLWDLRVTPPVARTLSGHEDAVRALTFSPDGSQLVSGDNAGVLRWWDVATGRTLREPLQAHDNWINGLAFSRDGQRLASASQDGTLRLFDGTSGAPLGARLKGHDDAVNVVAFSPDGSQFVSGSDDKTLRRWDTSTATPIGDPMSAHEALVSGVAYSPDGKRIVSSSEDRSLRLWNAETGKRVGDPIKGHDGEVRAVAYSPDGTRLLSASADGTWRLWNASGTDVFGMPMWLPRLPLAIAFAADGANLLALGEDRGISTWNTATGRAAEVPTRGSGEAVTAAALSPDGSRMVVAGRDNLLRQWPVRGGTPLGEPMAGHTKRVRVLAYSPGGNRIASGGEDGNLRLWDARSGGLIATAMAGRSSIASVAFAPNGQRVAVGFADGTLRLFDTQRGEPSGEALRGHDKAVLALAFSPDGSQLTSGSVDGSMRLWDLRAPRPSARPLSGHVGAVTALAYSADGRRLASAGTDRSVRQWDARSGTAVGVPMKGHGNSVTALAFSPDGSLIASAARDRTLRLWPSYERWPQLLCDKLSHDLDPRQWMQLVSPDIPFADACPGLPDAPGGSVARPVSPSS